MRKVWLKQKRELKHKNDAFKTHKENLKKEIEIKNATLAKKDVEIRNLAKEDESLKEEIKEVQRNNIVNANKNSSDEDIKRHKDVTINFLKETVDAKNTKRFLKDEIYVRKSKKRIERKDWWS